MIILGKLIRGDLFEFFKRIKFAIAFTCAVLIIPVLAQFEVEVTSDPSQVKLNYDDLNNFFATLDLIEDGHDPVETVQKYYLSRASKAFQDQIDSRNITAEKMAAFITDNPESVKKLRELPKNLRLQEDAIRQAGNTFHDLRFAKEERSG